MAGENVQPRADRASLGYQARRSDDTLRRKVSGDNQIAWNQLDTTGSNLTDLTTRNHSDLQSVGQADETDTDTTKDKHVSNQQLNDNKVHRDANSAHGASGNIVGNADWATESVGGVVKLCDLVNNVAAATAAALTDSTTGTASQTINDVGAAFSQSTLNDNFASLTDEINKLITDNADLRTQVNDLIAEMKTAKQMNTV